MPVIPITVHWLGAALGQSIMILLSQNLGVGGGQAV